jgi:hypothetical protein
MYIGQSYQITGFGTWQNNCIFGGITVKIMRALFILLAAVSVLSACRTAKNAPAEDMTIIHGTSFGHCVGYCVREEIYSGDKLTLVRRSRQEENPEIVIDSRSAENAKNFGKLTNSFKMADFVALPETLGCPDCADGGAEYIEIRTPGSVKRVTFEYGSEPEGIAALLDLLREVREEKNSK